MDVFRIMECTFHVASLGRLQSLTDVSVVDKIGVLSLNMSDEKVPPLNAAVVSDVPGCCYKPFDRSVASGANSAEKLRAVEE